MWHLIWNEKIQLFRVGLVLMLLGVIATLPACTKSETVAAGDEPQSKFESPEEAGTALLQAAKAGNQAALIAIFGPSAKAIVFSGDPAMDQNALKDFATAYETMHRWGKIKAGGEMLYIGAANFPFPVPLLQNTSGKWYFDTGAGMDEILARRIGRDELVAIAAVAALANAEQEYFNQADNKVKQYAQKFVSDEGTHNGLYWSAPDGSTQSPLGQLGHFAKGAGYMMTGGKPQPFHGYYFRILTKQRDSKGAVKDYVVNGNMTGGFAILAYPAEYQNSGVMSFLIGTDGVVYEKDLGEKTVDIASTMTEYDPGRGWKPVK